MPAVRLTAQGRTSVSYSGNENHKVRKAAGSPILENGLACGEAETINRRQWQLTLRHVLRFNAHGLTSCEQPDGTDRDVRVFVHFDVSFRALASGYLCYTLWKESANSVPRRSSAEQGPLCNTGYESAED
jgi:hypothetical protein